ncbi:MAG: DUF1194 domain-containing protein [Pseudomonadota bacterium]
MGTRGIRAAAPCVFAAFAAIFAAAPGAARAVIPVDLELVLAADGSGSIDDEELKFQRHGYAEALAHPRVLAAIQSGFHKAIAVAYIEWGAPQSQHIIADWTLIRDETSAMAFGHTLIVTPRAAFGYNSISNAIAFSANLIETNTYQGTRRVIDLSGDGPQIGGRPLQEVRRETVAQGITINALVIETPAGSLRGPGGIPLAEHYERDVIGGAGAFIAVARERSRFPETILKKLVLEIAEAPPR